MRRLSALPRRLLPVPVTTHLPLNLNLNLNLVLTLLFISSPLFSQTKSIKQYVHQIFTAEQGLPQNSASQIIQTRDGYIWFATQEGVARFDGMEFTVYDRTNTKELPSSWMVRLKEDSSGAIWMRPVGFGQGITRLANGNFTHFDTSNGLPNGTPTTWEVDRRGAMWIGTQGGLWEFFAGNSRMYRVADGLPSDTIRGLKFDSKGNLWISTQRGLARLTDGTFEIMTGREEFPDALFNNVNVLACCYEDRQGTLWFSSPTHLLAYRDGKAQRFEKKSALSDPAVRGVHQDARGTLWLSTASGLTSYADGKFTKYHVSADEDENSIFAIREDREGSLWLGTNKGVVRFADGKFEKFQKSDGLSDNNIQDILIDREGSIWVSTFGGGIDRFRDEKFVTYSTLVGLSDDNVEALMQDRSGAIWVGTSFGPLNRVKDGKITHFDTPKEPHLVDVRALGEDGEGTLWIGSRRGLYTMRNGSIVTVSKLTNGVPDLEGDAFLLRKSGEWLVGSRTKLLSFKSGKFTELAETRAHSTLNRDFISGMIEARDGTIWVGTQGGLYWYRDGTLESVSPELGYRANWGMSFYEDPDGTMWVGTGNAGIFRYKDGKFSSISPREGLFDYNVYTILPDAFGYLWMSCNKGVYRVKKQELDDVADGKASTVTCNSYGSADGMESRECNGGYAPAGWRLSDGRLCFSTVKGVTIVNPADIRINEVPPPVVINRFLVEGELQQGGGQVRVPAGKSRFEFQYAGISFVGSQKVRYRYKLEGLDESWVDAGSRREAFFTNLDPGEYTFRVIAANSDGVWNHTGASVSFVLLPHFYQTAWFIGLVALIFLTSGPSYYLYRMRSMKRRREELERLVQERTGELQKTLNNLKEMQNQLVLSEKMASLGQLTAGIAHEIKNPLNFITNFSVLSHDLTKDLRKELQAERTRVDPQRAQEIESLLNDLEQNVNKINEHGKRADSIVRGMLLHSRGKAGERQETDLNALLAEYTNLAYHGMRAQDQSFNVKIETDLDPAIGKVSVVPQDLSRAFLNIVNNACYAANDKRRTASNGFNPVVRVSARNIAGSIEIRIRDNGNGIPDSIREKIFNPFFTTKPAGSGTGLGLSLSYDIITQEHRGEISVNTREGEFTEFVITIPRNPDMEKGNAA
ncbi:MAG: two-component regulator propeller domain-containing protein [Bacteroidota bacterium]